MEFITTVLSQTAELAKESPDAVPTTTDLNLVTAFFDAVAPQDAVEAALAAQMFATHMVGMLMLRRTKFCSTLPGSESYSTMATKMLRTYAAQVETLAKLRRKGEQVVRVEHVHVYEGGQAIVGSVTMGEGGDSLGYRRQPPAPEPRTLVYGPGEQMRCPHKIGGAMPQSSNSGTEAVPHARRGKRQRRA